MFKRIFYFPETSLSQVSSQQVLVFIHLSQKEGKLISLGRKERCTMVQISAEPESNQVPCGQMAEILPTTQTTPTQTEENSACFLNWLFRHTQLIFTLNNVKQYYTHLNIYSALDIQCNQPLHAAWRNLLLPL